MAAIGTQAKAASSRLQALVDPADPQCVLGVAVIARGADGQVRFADAAGAAVRGEGERRLERPLTLEDPVRVASVSKLVLMAGFMKLVEAGVADLEADVSEALGFRLRHPVYPELPITAAMLASHTSGLRDSPSYPLPLGRRLRDAFEPGGQAYENGAWFAPPGEAPGRVFGYANVNFAVLAQVMERLAGERFDRLMSRTVFEPLGLDCGYNWSGVTQAKRDRASSACRRQGGLWTPAVDADVPRAPEVRVAIAPGQPHLSAQDYRLAENGWVFSPQGGLRASTRDLDLLAQLFARGGSLDGRRLLSEASLQRMQTPRWRFDPAARNGEPYGGAMRAYGLAVQALTGWAAPDGDALFGTSSAQWRGHLGQAYGLRSGLWWNAHDGRTLVYVLNGTPPAVTPGRSTAFSAWEEEVIAATTG